MTIKRQYAMSKKEKQLLMKIDTLRLKFLRLLKRMGNSQTRPDTLFEQVMHRLGLADTLVLLDRIRPFDQEKSFLENVIKKCKLVEDEEPEDFNFSCNILVLGKTGVGKSSTINSIFDGQKEITRAYTNPFIQATKSISEISGIVDGVHLRFFDTPGLKTSLTDQGANIRILKSIKKHIKSCPPDIVLYVDRIDSHTLDFNDFPLLRSITSVFGSSMWFNTIVAFTHAASDPPDGPDGCPLSYELFVAQRSHAIQQSIRRATTYNGHMNPLALVENHPCNKRQGDWVLPNGLSWRLHLLLQCYSSIILSDSDSHFKLNRKLNPRRFGSTHSPFPLLLSSFLQSKGHLKFLALNPVMGRVVDCFESDIDLHDFSITELLEVDDIDKLPPFKSLRKSRIAKLTIDEKKAYFAEFDYRVKLLQKKVWMDRLRMFKGINLGNEYWYFPEFFDRDIPYRFISVPTYPFSIYILPTQNVINGLVTTKWDNSYALSNIAGEQYFNVAGLVPIIMVAILEKEKNILKIDNFETTVAIDSIDHDELDGSTKLRTFKMQSIDGELACTFVGETKWKISKKKNIAAGISVTFIGESIVSGFKLEEQVLLENNSISLVGSTGIMADALSRESAYGAKLETRFKDKACPMGAALSTFGFSVCKRQGNLSFETDMQCQLSLGRNSSLALQITSKNLKRGSITIKATSSCFIIGIFPVFGMLLNYFLFYIL